MTTASKGLAKALGRSASGDVIALAEMSSTDLLASMTDEQKAELAASLAPPTPPAAGADADAGDKPMKEKAEDDGDEDDADGKPKPPMAAAADADRVKAVAAAVESDPACQGKAALALQMLADDDFAGLNAAGLVKLIGKTPVDGAKASEADPEAAAREEMKAALSDQNNSNLDANGGTAPANPANSSAVWDKAIARVFPGAPA